MQRTVIFQALFFLTLSGEAGGQITTVPEYPEGKTALVVYGQELISENVVKHKALDVISSMKEKLEDAIKRTALHEWKSLRKSDDLLGEELAVSQLRNKKIVGVISIWLPDSNSVTIRRFEGKIDALGDVETFESKTDSLKRTVRGIKVAFADPATLPQALVLPFSNKKASFLDGGLSHLFYLRYHAIYFASNGL